MNWKSADMIALYVFLGLTVVSFSLISVWDPFAIIGSVFLTLSFAIMTFESFVSYLIYKRQKADEKLSEAYLYAEEIGNEDAMKHFSYDKKTERKLKLEKFNRRLIPLAFLTLTLFGVILIIICARII